MDKTFREKIEKEDLDVVSQEAITLLSSRDDVHNPQHYKRLIYGALIKKDFSVLDEIYGLLEKPFSKLSLEFYTTQIIQAIGCHLSEIEESIGAIHSDIEGDIVLACVEGSDWITLLDKEFLLKNKAFKYVYKDQVRLHRRMLEKELQEAGVGIRRSTKISKILLSI